MYIRPQSVSSVSSHSSMMLLNHEFSPLAPSAFA
jgi:hypothetical protein